MRRLILPVVLLSLLILDAKVYSQGGTVQTIEGRVLKETDKNTIEGSPYFAEDWQDGYFINVDNKKVEVKKLQYDMSRDQLIILNSSNPTAVANHIVSEFVIERFTEKNSIEEVLFTREYGNGYLQVLAKAGELALLKKYVCDIMEIKTNGYGETGRRQRYVIDEIYFIADGAKVTETRLKKKDVLEALGSRAGAAEDYMKAERIKAKDEEEAIELIKFLGTVSN